MTRRRLWLEISLISLITVTLEGTGAAQPRRYWGPWGAVPYPQQDDSSSQPVNASGWIVVKVSPPDAEVLVDGWPLKVDPVTGESQRLGVLVGSHSVEVNKAGFPSYRTEVGIGQGRLERLTVNLDEGEAPRAPARAAKRPRRDEADRPVDTAESGGGNKRKRPEGAVAELPATKDTTSAPPPPQAALAAKSTGSSASGSDPVIEITEPTEDARRAVLQLGAKSVSVRGRAKDPQGIYAVTVNRQPANLRAIDSHTVEFWIDEVLLSPGRNDVTVAATDTTRVASQVSFTVERPEMEVGPGAGSAVSADRWALIVGISKYGSAAKGIGNLEYARRDAETLHAFLRTPAGGGFPDDHVLLLTDEQATSSNVRGGVRDFLGRAGENDLVIIFFAGHGTPDPARPNALYLLTYDSDIERLGATAFDMDEIKLALAKNISAKRVVALVDACHSAGVGTVLAARAVPNGREVVNRYLHEVARARAGVVMFTASQTNEPSFEDSRWGGGHGVFTFAVLEGLQGAADRSADGIVSLQELIDFVSDKVKQETNYKQHPTASTSVMWDPNLPLAMIPQR